MVAAGFWAGAGADDRAAVVGMARAGVKAVMAGAGAGHGGAIGTGRRADQGASQPHAPVGDDAIRAGVRTPNGT